MQYPRKTMVLGGYRSLVFFDFGRLPDSGSLPHALRLATFRGSRRPRRTPRRRCSASFPVSEKEFSKKVLTGEQTADNWELGGKMLPNLRNKAFPPCGHADGGYVLLRVSGISYASTTSGVYFEPDSVYRRVCAGCANRHVWASSGAAGSRCHGDGQCCLRGASEFGADPSERVVRRKQCIRVAAVAGTTRSQEVDS